MTNILKYFCYIYVGDNMKNYIKVIIGAVLIGGIFAYFFYNDIKKEVVALTTQENTISLFQVGVFSQIDNAKHYQELYNPAIIYETDNYYRVIIGISYHEENKVKLESYFTNKGIEYIIKEIKVNEDFINELENYETVLIKTNKDDVIANINKSMLDMFLGYLN